MIGASFTLDFNTAVVGTAALAAVSAGVARASVIIAEEAQGIVHVRSGELRDSIQAQEPVIDGNTATAEVTAGTDHNFYVEYGTGKRGEASPGAGPGPYDPNWPGMDALPYMRPPLDTRRDDVFSVIAEEVENAFS
jgi:hypothetical protein